jgi:ATP-dependent exoDNAse (exonuclease V) beta subunit
MLLQATHIDQDTLEGGSPFVGKRSIIPPVSEQSMRRLQQNASFSKATMAAKEDWYRSTPRSLDLRPVKIAATSLSSNEDISGATLLPLCPSDAILDRLENPYADFGTYAHAVVEAAVLHQEFPLLEEVVTSSSPLLSDAVSKADTKILTADVQQFAQHFIESSFYREEVQPNKVSCEVKFFTAYPEDDMEKAVEGAIDLLVEDAQGNLSGVDFKTDSYRSEEKHATQLVIYMLAVSRLYPGKKVRGCIIYLREKEIVPSFMPFC